MAYENEKIDFKSNMLGDIHTLFNKSYRSGQTEPLRRRQSHVTIEGRPGVLQVLILGRPFEIFKLYWKKYFRGIIQASTSEA